MFSRYKQKGFTLIELLVVIAIMGILFAVSLPAFRTYERNAAVRVEAKELRSFFWSAQALSLSPERTDINTYSVSIGRGTVGTVIRENGTNNVAERILAPWQPSAPVTIESITATTAAGASSVVNTAAIDFDTSNAGGGKMVIRSGGADYTKLVIRLVSTASPLIYEVVVDAGNNTIDMRRGT